MRKKLFRLLLPSLFVGCLLLAAAPAALAQWTAVPAVPARPVVALGARGDTLIAAMDTSLVYRSTDGGINWSAVALSEPAAVGHSLTILDDTLYLGTLDHGLFRSADRGASWSFMGPGLPQAVTDVTRFNGILYASTDGAGVRRYDAASGNWQAFNNGLPTFSNNVSTILVAGNRLMIGAGGNGTYYVYDFNAGNWIEQYYYGTYLPALDVNEILNTSDTLYAVNRNHLIRSNDAGLSWSDDAVDTRSGADRWIYAGSELLYTLTNLSNNTCWIQQRDRRAAPGSSWSANEELANGYAYDLLETSSRLFLAREDGLFTRPRTTDLPETNRAALLRLAPNPAAVAGFSVYSSLPSAQLGLYDLTGRIVFETRITQWPYTHQASLRPGVYQVHLRSDAGILISRKLVVQ